MPHSGDVEGISPDTERLRYQVHPHYHPQNYHHLDATVTVLWVLTPVLATLSVIIICVAVSTNQWLLTEEKMANPNYNGTGDKEFLLKKTISGLWVLCYTNPGESELFCSNIEYLTREEYIPDPNDSTNSIPYAVKKSATFFILATILTFIGELSCLIGHLSRQHRLCTFISGVIFIISGLLMLIGLVMYISIFKAEIGSKLRPKSQLQPALFTFRYGYSFISYVSGFISTEVTGTCAVFLFIYWHQKEWEKKRSYQRKLSDSTSVLFNIENEPIYPICRRHPQYSQPLYISSNNIRLPPQPSTSIPPRRFYLDKESRATSDNDITNSSYIKHNNINYQYDFSPDYGPQKHNQKVGTDDQEFPPPPPEAYINDSPVIEYRVSRNYFPRDATTNTVSTTADIEEDYSLDLTHEHEFVTFDLDANPITVPPPTLSRICENDVRTKDTLRKTTPV